MDAMGKLILCSGARTARPYVFEQTGIKVYSIEEMCYYLYHHVYLIDEEMFCDTLFDFIDTELLLKERAEKLRSLKKQKSDLKTMVTIILCSSDYYTEYEIKSILKILDEVIGMPMIKRNCIKAGILLREQQYSRAAEEYVRIINSREAADLTPEEYGDLFHNLAVAKVHITGLKEASRLFYQAYERNHREESLMQYLVTLLLCRNEEGYLEKAEEYRIGAEMDYKIREFLSEKEKEAESAKLLQDIRQLNDTMAQGKMSEFYNKIDEIIGAWKEKVRQS
jgi:hypothetical protein